MIHGDVKPQNCLIFFDEGRKMKSDWSEEVWIKPDITHAKLADFGYAGWSMDSSKQCSLYLPESRPWTGPEYHHRAFDIYQARQLEIFSFGLTCLWFLFHDKIADLLDSDSHLKETYHGDSFYNVKTFEKLKYDGLLSQLAYELVENANSINSEVRGHLLKVLNSTLDMDPEKRCLPLQSLVAAAGYEA